MSDPNAGFPIIQAPFTNKAGHINQAWLQLLISLWNRTGGGAGGGGGTGSASFWAGQATGNANGLILTVATPPTGYQDGQRFGFQALLNNSGPAVARVGSLATLPVKKANSIPLDEKDILLNHFYELVVTSGASQFELNEFMPQSPQEVLRLLLTVDGSGSGLDADLLDGLDSESFLGINVLVSQIFGA